MNRCRVCGEALAAPDYFAPAPAMTSLSTLIGVESTVHVCAVCGHVQSPDLPDVQAFYDTEYRISLQSEGHDQLYEVKGGKPVFRTAHQADLMLGLGIPQGAAVLDFGAAKAKTLSALCAARPDIRPYVFDVSEDYRAHWSVFVPATQQATYALPARWAGQFDLVAAHFVIEHVADPVAVLRSLAGLLAPRGRLFFSVPDPFGNSGDLLVVDHLNHFTVSSITVALTRAGLRPLSIRQDMFRGAHVVLAEVADPAVEISSPAATAMEARGKLVWWHAALTRLESEARNLLGPAAIYGAGFYGTLIASRLPKRPVCFLDRNPHLQGGTHLGLPVLAPEACPRDLAVIYAGLNPDHASSILPADADWLPGLARVVYLAA